MLSSQENCHHLILDGHGSHITIQALKHIAEVGLDMVTLFAHTSHALQPLDVISFKPFKITFRKKKTLPWQKNNYLELDKVALVAWVDKALQQSSKKENIKLGFRVFGI